MNILIVCSFTREKISPFIQEQTEALKQANVKINYFLIKEKGLIGYYKSWIKLKKRIKSRKYDLIHAHYGLCGLISVLQNKIPVIITFHGSDVNNRNIRFLSLIASKLSACNIIVTSEFREKLRLGKNYTLIPCGINLTIFRSKNYYETRATLGIAYDENIVLFSSSFNNPVKNYPLAKEAIELCKTKPRLIELNNFTREEVCNWMNASDLLLLTSFSEGSPQVVKEAIACTLPVLATEVGDLRDIQKKVAGIMIAPFDAQKIASYIDTFFSDKYRVQNERLIQDYNNDTIAKKIMIEYQKVIKSKVR